MKLRKMITVSAAALMLAGVGASATNADASVHASRRTTRVSQLSSKKSGLENQIRSDKSQVKQINREIIRLNRKSIRKGKRSKKTVKRHKQTKKGTKKNKKRTRRTKRNRKSTKNNKKLTPKQKAVQQKIMKQYQAQMIAANKQRTPVHIQINGEVYKAEVNGLNQLVSKKPYMSYKSYVAKNRKALNKNQKTMKSLQARYNKLHDQKSQMKFLQSKKVQQAEKQNQKINVFGVQAPKAQNTKK